MLDGNFLNHHRNEGGIRDQTFQNSLYALPILGCISTANKNNLNFIYYYMYVYETVSTYYLIHFKYMYFPTNILQLDINSFAEVQEALWEAKVQWYNVGVRLRMKVHELDTIDVETGDDTSKKLTRMVKSRLNMMEPCTWRDLYEALKHPTVDMPYIADKLKSRLGNPIGE